MLFVRVLTIAILIALIICLIRLIPDQHPIHQNVTEEGFEKIEKNSWAKCFKFNKETNKNATWNINLLSQPKARTNFFLPKKTSKCRVCQRNRINSVCKRCKRNS